MFYIIDKMKDCVENKIKNTEIDQAESVFVSDVKAIIVTGQKNAYGAVNTAMIETFWNVGKRISEQELHGKKRAEYGKHLIDLLSIELTTEFGKSFNRRNLFYYRKFYGYFPDWKIVNACVHNLTWTHVRSLLRVHDENARLWYMKESNEQGWNYRTLDRNIATQYYYRLLQSPQKEKVVEEMKIKTAEYESDRYKIFKNPIVAEFLGFRTEDSFTETELETAILSHIRDFLIEMGRGFAFVARQQHIVTDIQDYFIDLVFYNVELKCYVLIDLKIGPVTPQDVGQMDMYVRMYDDLKRKDGDNPTIGILLCSETSEDIARYSILHDSENIFMAKYLTYLPSKEIFKTEIEHQKEIFQLQCKENKDKK